MLLEQKDLQINLQDECYGWTALMWASRKGHKDIIEILLLNEETNINQQDKDGKTALMNAASRGHKEIVDLLLAAKANIKIANNKGRIVFVILLLQLVRVLALWD